MFRLVSSQFATCLSSFTPAQQTSLTTRECCHTDTFITTTLTCLCYWGYLKAFFYLIRQLLCLFTHCIRNDYKFWLDEGESSLINHYQIMCNYLINLNSFFSAFQTTSNCLNPYEIETTVAVRGCAIFHKQTSIKYACPLKRVESTDGTSTHF